MISQNEIFHGLALYLDPDAMLYHGAEFTGLEVCRVRGAHYFVCVDRTGTQSFWLPLFSRGGAHRGLIPRSCKLGHPRWVSRDSYFHPSQVWSISIPGLIRAEAELGDYSTPDARNWVTMEIQLDPKTKQVASVNGTLLGKR